ncbi:MAG: zf-HC2 domain-containing protein [Phycisphaerales bacterium]|nr:zf-HC2 domain-containing protein [Phycisphaerales bacterium]MCB9856326.1 zf-HC2 domain-containing protein [Phycisphaerales bacterium]
MDCRTFESLLADAIGGELGDSDRAAFESHADACENCRREYRSLASTMNLVRDRIGTIDAQSNRHGRETSAKARSSSRRAIFRYAAIIAIAFLAGYALRGIDTAQPAAVPGRKDVEARAITVHEQIAVAHRRMPEASMFAKSMLAVLGPNARDSRQ